MAKKKKKKIQLVIRLMRQRKSKQIFLDAYKDCLSVSEAASIANVRSRTVYGWIKEDKQFSAQIKKLWL